MSITMTTTDQGPRITGALDDLAQIIDVTTDRIVVSTTGDHDVDARTLPAIATLLGAVDRIIAAVVTVLQTAGHHATITAHGMTRDAWLRAVAHRTGADAGMLVAAAERLTAMPAVTAWFRDGTLTWSAVRGIVAATRTLTGEQRGWVDDQLRAARDRILAMDSDQVVSAAEGLANQARPDLHRDRENRSLHRRWLTIQSALDGTARIHGELDAETAAAALTAFGAPTTAGGPPHGDGSGDDAAPDSGRRRANVDVFRSLCEQRLTRRASTPSTAPADPGDAGGAHASDQGPSHRHSPAPSDPTGQPPGAADAPAADAPMDTADAPTDTTGTPTGPAKAPETGGADAPTGTSDTPTGQAKAPETGGADAPTGTSDTPTGGADCAACGSAPSTARPSMLVIAPLGALLGDGSANAQLLWNSTSGPVEITAATAQRLACDATMRTVITDGALPLGATAAHPKVSATLRAALVVRDGGCRFPACQRPADVCDNHHIVPVLHGGPTRLDNLLLLCRDHHHAVHDSNWRVALGDDASATFSRRAVTLSSACRHDQRIHGSTPPPAGRPPRHTGHATADGRDATRRRSTGDDGAAAHRPTGRALPF